MAERPYVLLSAAMSVDGYIDDATDQRLLLSDNADLDRVDEVRAGVDAILVGANTIRRDNPRLLVRSPARREQRVTRGLAESPIKVTITGRVDLDPAAPRFVREGAFPHHPDNRMKLAEVRRIGDVVLLRYLLRRPARPTRSDDECDPEPGQMIGRGRITTA